MRAACPECRRTDGSRADTVIAAEYDGQSAATQRGERRAMEPLTHLRNLTDVFLSLVARPPSLGQRRHEIALVAHLVAERCNTAGEPRDAESRRTHVDAAPSAAQI